MLKIFANYGTSDKVAVYCHPGQIRDIMKKLNEKFGGNWILVDEVKISGEILKFNDNQVYRGFEPSESDDFRYSKAIVDFSLYK